MTYSELIKIPSFEHRLKALMLEWRVGEKIDDQNRFLAQDFYHSYEWREIIRPSIIARDNGYDLACPDHPIKGHISVHHLIPITEKDFITNSSKLYDPELLISMSDKTHRAIHYGTEDFLMQITFVERRPDDTVPWK